MTAQGVASLLRFSRPEVADWRSAAESALRGGSLDGLVVAGDDGIDIQPLYTEELFPTAGDPAGLPGRAPFTRGVVADPTRLRLRQRHDLLVDPAETAAAIRDDLAGGVDAVWLRLQRPPEPGELLAALAGVNPAETPVTVDGGPWFGAASQAVGALASPVGLTACADPLGALARFGFLTSEPTEALSHLAELLVTETTCRSPGGRVITLDATVYADAGAPPSLELAAMLATGVAYLRAAEEVGIDPATAARHIGACLVATPDVFATICRFRAARTLWDRVLEACGVHSRQRQGLSCAAVTSEAALVTTDPYLNLVRATTAAFAAMAAGADCLSVLAHDCAFGPATEQGRRLARNVGHLLADESHLGAVVDPAGGSWYVEERTARLAEAAWERFAEIEAAGGMVTALLDGSMASRIATEAGRRSERLARGDEHIVGVTCFPPPSAEGDPAPRPVLERHLDAPGASDAPVRIEPLPVRRPRVETSP